METTSCDCPTCVSNCRHIPGYLAVSDLPRMAAAISPGKTPLEFAREYLLASPGAVLEGPGKDGVRRRFRVGTLVPKRGEDDACVFLKEGRCSVHAHAPFGCAFFDCVMPQNECDRLSEIAIKEIMLDEGEYTEVWKSLRDEGKTARPPEECRERMAQTDRVKQPPQTVEQMRERFAAAVAEPYVGDPERPPRPHETPARRPECVFEFEDGIRMVVSREVHAHPDAVPPLDGEFLHASFSCHADSPFLAGMVRASVSPEAVLAGLVGTCRGRLAAVSGYSGPASGEGTTAVAYHILVQWPVYVAACAEGGSDE